MRRTIQDLLEDPLAHGLLKGEYLPGDVIVVTRRGDGLHLTVDRKLNKDVEAASVVE